MEFLNSFKACIINIYIFAPCIFASILGCLYFLKNPIYIRRLSKIFFLIQFFFASFLMLFIDKTEFSAFGVNLLYDKSSSIFLFLNAIVFLLFLFVSKIHINKLHRVFYSVFALLSFLLNFIIVTDSVFAFLVGLFWFILISYFLFEIFSDKKDKKEKKEFKTQLFFDLGWFLVALILISLDFVRYFVVNSLEFDFSKISQHLYHISDVSILCAFYGFLILIFKFFNFIPFDIKIIKNSANVKPFISFFVNLLSLIIASILFVKVFLVFNYLFYQEQEKISIFLLINFVYFVILSHREDKLTKFALSIVPVVIISGIFNVFCFDADGLTAFMYYAIAAIFSLQLMYFIFSFIIAKTNADNIDELKRISSSFGLVKFFTVIALFNLAKIPFLALSIAFLVSISLMFSTNYDVFILNLFPYFIVFGNFVLSLNLLNMVYKIIIEPQENTKINLTLPNHQIISMALVLFVLILMAFSVQWFFGYYANFVVINS